MGKPLGFRMYVIFPFTYQVSYTSTLVLTFYHTYTAEEGLHNFLADDNS